MIVEIIENYPRCLSNVESYLRRPDRGISFILRLQQLQGACKALLNLLHPRNQIAQHTCEQTYKLHFALLEKNELVMYFQNDLHYFI